MTNKTPLEEAAKKRARQLNHWASCARVTRDQASVLGYDILEETAEIITKLISQLEAVESRISAQSGAVCKGSLLIGSGCGSCSRCKAEIKSMIAQINSAAARYEDLSVCYDVVSQASKDKGMKLEAAEARIAEQQKEIIASHGLGDSLQITLGDNKRLKAQIADKDAVIAQCNGECARLMNEKLALEAEIAELRGATVPVGLVEIGMPSTIESAEFCYVFRSKKFIPYGTSIFTHPVPPVVAEIVARE